MCCPVHPETCPKEEECMTSPVVRAQVEVANRRFYEALEAKDPDALGACWAGTDDVACVHPGGPWVTGWEDVRDAWEFILANTGYMEVGVEVVNIAINDPVALVTCIEHVTTAHDGERVEASVAATNVFELGVDGWRMVLHHASPIVRMIRDDEA
jgi:ketosteroid isomerase-like protein